MSEVGIKMTPIQAFFSRVKNRAIMWRRSYIPYLVWWGQEIDARLVWKENALPKDFALADPSKAIEVLNRGRIYEIEKQLHEIGISFDKGMGCGGRDWELDWSLRGPLNVRFAGPCKTEEKRR